MDKFFAEIMADELTQEESDIFDALLDLHGRLLVVCHDVGVFALGVDHPVYVRHLGLHSRKLLVSLHFQKLLDDEWSLFFGSNQVGLVPC